MYCLVRSHDVWLKLFAGMTPVKNHLLLPSKSIGLTFILYYYYSYPVKVSIFIQYSYIVRLIFFCSNIYNQNHNLMWLFTIWFHFLRSRSYLPTTFLTRTAQPSVHWLQFEDFSQNNITANTFLDSISGLSTPEIFCNFSSKPVKCPNMGILHSTSTKCIAGPSPKCHWVHPVPYGSVNCRPKPQAHPILFSKLLPSPAPVAASCMALHALSLSSQKVDCYSLTLAWLVVYHIPSTPRLQLLVSGANVGKYCYKSIKLQYWVWFLMHDHIWWHNVVIILRCREDCPMMIYSWLSSH